MIEVIYKLGDRIVTENVYACSTKDAMIQVKDKHPSAVIISTQKRKLKVT